MHAVILRRGHDHMRLRQTGMTQQRAPELRRIIGQKKRHIAFGALFAQLHAHTFDHFHGIMQPAGCCRSGCHGQTRGQMFAHSLGTAAADIAAVKPDVALEQGQFPDTLGGKPGRRRQDETRPVVKLQTGPGQQSILRAAADIHAKDRAVPFQEMSDKFIHKQSPRVSKRCIRKARLSQVLLPSGLVCLSERFNFDIGETRGGGTGRMV